MIFAGYQYGASILDLITIACSMSVQSLMNKDYIRCNPFGVSPKLSQYYSKLLIGDDFIEYVLIWNEFAEILSKSTKNMETHIDEWAEKRGINVASMYALIEIRDEVIINMLTLGLNPYYNGLDLMRGSYNLNKILHGNIEEGMSEIIKIKQCIYEGYRTNLSFHNIGMKTYQYTKIDVHRSILLKNGNLKSTPVGDLRLAPFLVVFDDYLLTPSLFKPDMFEFKGTHVSVGDGFIVTDPQFNQY
jgi:hypothetical protein